MVRVAIGVSKNPPTALPLFLQWGLLSSIHVRNHTANLVKFNAEKWIAADKVG